MSAMVAVERAITAGRAAGKHWAGEPLAKRVKFVRALREALALEAESIAGYVSGGSRPLAEVLSAEVLPLLEACRFLEREAATLLKTRRLGISGRPVWLGRVDAEIRREPHGVVAVVAPSNYPLFLPGVQALQAIAAGNAVVWKPAAGGGCVASAFLQIARKAGLPEFVLQVLPESVEAGRELVAGRVDKVIFTGGSSAGVQVLHALADRAVPAVVELSGCDAVFVRQDADVRLVARAMRFGLQLNRSRTCIAPRRVFVARGLVEALEKALISEMACADKWNVSRAQSAHEERMSAWMEDARVRGGRFMWGGPQADGGRISLPCIVANASPEMELMQHDVFEAVLSLVAVDSDAHALELASRCPFALGATIFTRDEKAATHLATEVKAGWVCINDVIAPSADPRIPFGGTGRSGFGVTRGAEGLLEMTRLKVVQIRKGGPAVHLAPEEPTAPLLAGLIRMLHGGGWRARASGLFALIQNAAGGADAKAPKVHKSLSLNYKLMNSRPENIVVIGGGLGGLASACTLAARGYRVELLETNAWLGGKAAVHEDKGFRFDMGPTIVTLPSVLRRIFSEAGRELEDALEMVKLDPQWRSFFEDGTTLDLVADGDEMSRKIDAFSPGSGSGVGYRKFLNLSARQSDISQRVFFWKPIGSMGDMFSGSSVFLPGFIGDLLSIRMGRTVSGLLRSYVPDERVSQMLDHFTQYVGSSPENSPAVLCGIAHMQSSEGVWYPIGGTAAVPGALHKLALELGVVIRTGVSVKRIVVENGRATGVVTADGEQIRAAAVVSNRDSVRTHRELIGGEWAERFNRRRTYEPACSGVVLYLGLKKRYPQLLHHNFVFSADPHVEFDSIYREGVPAKDPTCYVCAPAATEPGVAPEGGEALYVLVHTPYLRPGQDWRAMLPGYRNVIIEKLKRVAGMSDIEENIVTERALTPQDIHDRYQVLDGAIYGLASHGRFLGTIKPSNRSSDIRGLYLAGGSAHPGPGMPMALMSGWIAADALDQDGVVPRDSAAIA